MRPFGDIRLYVATVAVFVIGFSLSSYLPPARYRSRSSAAGAGREPLLASSPSIQEPLLRSPPSSIPAAGASIPAPAGIFSRDSSSLNNSPEQAASSPSLSIAAASCTIRARFVRLSNEPVGGHLQASEIKVQNATGFNVARGKPCVASSVYGGAFLCEAVVDGATADGFYSSATSDKGEFVDIDLGEETGIAKITVFNRNDPTFTRLQGQQLLLLDGQRATVAAFTLQGLPGGQALDVRADPSCLVRERAASVYVSPSQSAAAAPREGVPSGASTGCAYSELHGRFYGLDAATAVAHAKLFAVFDKAQRHARIGNGDRRHSLPYISGDGFRHIADLVVEEPGDIAHVVAAAAHGGALAVAAAPGTALIVQCAGHLRDDLITAGLLDSAVVDIVLVGHNSDASGPSPDAPLLTHPRLRALFTQNCLGETERMHCIPIGLPNRRWNHGAALAELTEAVIAAAAGSGTPAPLRGQACFDVTHPERAPIMGIIAESNKWIDAPCSRDPVKYYASIVSVDAVVSPRGNGVDAHRSWEALLLGSLIITRHSSVDPLWRDQGHAQQPSWALPVLLLDDWPLLTASNTIDALCAARAVSPDARKRATEHVFFPYWACKVGTAAGRADEFCSTEALLKVFSH